ncbi:AAA family ATPase [Frankia sp. CNm7]|uniref:AAA family ATPase n=1 Tax=Frankia nepalensis TaxID=1836974 RepID=A0A937RLK6_9ACTN|nr:AAA family ATPase [Frankia nepalensis]MBL7496238.1 AAA family ATPase [Frankia nepalensis]MBL7514907.1 AAA family ATPase [Frankia nepalensis]MBL7524317.1 AAA family ATPase [Frankia nepalensis]MBL7631135.1 AAA family ATPase [Frankia nepalensis]
MVIVPTHGGTLSCPRCGTPAVPSARYCFHCGLRFTSIAGPEAAERRVVTVLFGDLSDFTSWAEDRDPERVGEVTDMVLAALAKEVDDVGGRVDNLAGDGIMAVFGAPTAHEDDAERAVRAAAAMQETVRRLVTDADDDSSPLGLRVGVNTGEVLAGVQASMTYTVVGDAVNTAARLSGAAAVGAVYAGRGTMHATRSVATWRELPDLNLKGKREPVPAYELVSLRPSNVARPGLGDDATFVGRDRELAELYDWFTETTRSGSPTVAVVTGEAGIGKSRLIGELASRAHEADGARVLWGRTVRHGDGRSLAPLADLIRGACGVVDGDSLDRVADRVRRTVGRLNHPLTGARLPAGISDRLLGLLGVPIDHRRASGATEAPPGDPASRESHGAGSSGERAIDIAVDTVTLLLSALAAEQPMIVVIDDLEWATSSLTRALHRLAERVVGPVMLTLLDREGLGLTDLPGVRQITLAPLPEEAATRLLTEFLGGATLGPQTRSALLGRVHGNPFFLAELLNLLIDRNQLRRLAPAEAAGADGPAWVLEGTLSETALPAGVQSVLAARIDDLEPTDKAVLRAAAVLGSRFPAAALPSVEERPATEVAAALERLTERQLVRAPRAGEQLWRFVHPMARDVAYAGLPKVERARRHSTAALWGVTAMTGSSREVSNFVATHALRAFDLASSMALPVTDPAWSAREPGFRALLRLARTALARDDHRTAADQLADARRLGHGVIDTDDENIARVLHAEALVSLRRLEEAERTLRPALRVTLPARRAAAYAVLGELRQKQGRAELATRALRTALDAARAAGDDRAAAAALRRLGTLEYGAGRIRVAEELYREALELARRVDDPRGVGWALQHLAWSATTRGDYPQAERSLRQATEVFERLEDAGGIGWCSGTEALVLLLSGQLARSRALARGLVDAAESMGERWGMAVCLTIGAIAAAELGDISAARTDAARATALFEGAGDSWGRILTKVAQGLAARGAGEPDVGADFLAGACADAAAAGQVLVGALASLMLGLTLLDAGRVDEAEQAARAAMAELGDLDLRPHAQLGAKVLAAQIARARGRLDESIGLLREALAASEPATLLFPRRQAYAHLAGTLLEAGQPEEALAVARRAVAVDAEDVRAQVLAWRALGTTLAASGDREGGRDAYLRALRAATSTEAVSEAPQTRRLLAALPDPGHDGDRRAADGRGAGFGATSNGSRVTAGNGQAGAEEADGERPAPAAELPDGAPAVPTA